MKVDIHFSSERETWATPWPLFRALDAEFHFTLDPCALPDSAKCAKYFTPEDDGLIQDWSNEVVFMNPPYSRVTTGLWMKKAFEESQRGALVVCLIPARTDTDFWHKYAMQADEIRLIRGRVHFDGQPAGAPFPSAVVIFRPPTADRRPPTADRRPVFYSLELNPVVRGAKKRESKK